MTLARLFKPVDLDAVAVARPTRPAAKLIPKLAETCPMDILVVEDNLVNVRVMQQVLNRLGFKDYDIAYDGQEAIEACRKRKYNLILMDLQYVYGYKDRSAY